jgi:hypothetical protein
MPVCACIVSYHYFGKGLEALDFGDDRVSSWVGIISASYQESVAEELHQHTSPPSTSSTQLGTPRKQPLVLSASMTTKALSSKMKGKNHKTPQTPRKNGTSHKTPSKSAKEKQLQNDQGEEGIQGKLECSLLH